LVSLINIIYQEELKHDTNYTYVCAPA